MRSTAAATAILLLTLGACSPAVLPSTSPSSVPTPRPTSGPSTTPPPTGIATDPNAGLFFPFPEGTFGPPTPDTPSATVEAQSVAGAAEVGEVYAFTLEHCGLHSPFDFDGSLWQPTGGVDAQGGPIDRDEELGELFNAISGQIVITDPNHAQFESPARSVVALERLPGPREYNLCD